MTELFNPTIHEVKEDFKELPPMYKLNEINTSDRLVEVGDYIRETDLYSFSPEDRAILSQSHQYFEIESVLNRRFQLSEDGQKLLDYIISPYGNRVRRLAEIQKLKD